MKVLQQCVLWIVQPRGLHSNKNAAFVGKSMRLQEIHPPVQLACFAVLRWVHSMFIQEFRFVFATGWRGAWG